MKSFILVFLLSALMLISLVSCEKEPQVSGEGEKAVKAIAAASYFQDNFIGAGYDAIFALIHLRISDPLYFEYNGSFYSPTAAGLAAGYAIEPGSESDEYFVTIPEKSGRYPSCQVKVYKEEEAPYVNENEFYVMKSGVGTVSAADCNGVDGKDCQINAIITDYTDEDGTRIKNSHFYFTEYVDGKSVSEFDIFDSEDNHIVFKFKEADMSTIIETATFNGVDIKDFLSSLYND